MCIFCRPEASGDTPLSSQDQEGKDSFVPPSDESCNFARLSMLVFDYASDAMREVLKNASGYDDAKLTQLVKSIKWAHHEKKNLLPAIKYDELDISVMYKIARNLLSVEIVDVDKSTADWGKEPKKDDLSLLAAIERIRHVRNEAVGHVSDTKLSKDKFDHCWNMVIIALDTIDKTYNLQKNYTKRAIHLKKRWIDPQCVELGKKLAEKEKMIDVMVEMDGM